MCFCKIHNIDVVSDAASVRGIVVVSENVQMVSDSCRGLSDERYQVLRHTSRQLAYKCGRMSTDRVEIPQGADFKMRESNHAVRQNLLRHLLAFAVRRKTPFKRSVLSDWQMLLVRLAVNGAGRREHDVGLLAFFCHQRYKVQKRNYVVAVVEQRFVYALPNSLAGSKMHRSYNVRMLLEHLAERLEV